MMAGIDPHPAVKAISPQAPMIDVWMGDDFFHNGAFRQSYGYDYVLAMESSKEDTGVDYGKDKGGQPVDGFDYFLERGSFAQDVKQSGVKAAAHVEALPRSSRLRFASGRSRGVEYALNTVAVPTLTVGGYYDQEDMWGPQEEYARLEPHDAHHENFLVLGPWRHGYWSSSSRSLGNLDYGEPIGKEFRAGIEAKFFAHYLKDAPGFDLENTASFQTGSNTWQYYAHFPPPQSAADQPLPSGQRPAELEHADCRCAHQLRQQSRRSGSLPSSAHPAHLLERLAVVQLAHRRPALRDRPQRRGRVEAARADARI